MRKCKNEQCLSCTNSYNSIHGLTCHVLQHVVEYKPSRHCTAQIYHYRGKDCGYPRHTFRMSEKIPMCDRCTEYRADDDFCRVTSDGWFMCTSKDHCPYFRAKRQMDAKERARWDARREKDIEDNKELDFELGHINYYDED